MPAMSALVSKAPTAGKPSPGVLLLAGQVTDWLAALYTSIVPGEPVPHSILVSVDLRRSQADGKKELGREGRSPL